MPIFNQRYTKLAKLIWEEIIKLKYGWEGKKLGLILIIAFLGILSTETLLKNSTIPEITLIVCE